MSNTILIHGASGFLGSKIIKELLSMGYVKESIVAAARDPSKEKVVDLVSQGVKAIKCDLLDKASLVEAYKGVSTVVYIPPPAAPIVAATTVQNSIDASKEAGVKRFVSIPATPTNTTNSVCILNAGYLYIEQATKTSGLEWTILNMGLWFDNQLGDFQRAAESGVLAIPAKSTTRTPSIGRDDNAYAMAKALLRDDLVGKVLTFAGASAISFEEEAKILSEVIGKKIVHKQVSVDEYVKLVEPKLGAHAPFVGTLLANLYDSAEREEFSITNDFYAITGRLPVDLKQWLTENFK